ncbi:MAG: hypothetical protein RSA79_05255 [Oscillospiraceae bacterium]
MDIAIIGSRDKKSLTIDTVLEKIPKDCTKIISGGAVGVDQLAKTASKILGVSYQEYLPNYEIYGRTAPLIRDKTIANSAQLVLAFWDYKSNGTRFTILYCLEKKIPVKIFIIGDEGEVKFLNNFNSIE